MYKYFQDVSFLYLKPMASWELCIKPGPDVKSGLKEGKC